MEDIGKIFRNLGNNFGPKEENSEQVAALENKLNDIQSEMYGTIEALVARVRSLEQQLAELKVEMAESPSAEYTNAFDLMTPEELLGRKPQPIDPLHIDDVTSVKGFVAPPPNAKEEEIDLPSEEENDLVKPDFDDATLDMYDILNDDDPNHLDASEIITYIESYGGILNQEMKKKEVLRSDISDKDRKIVYELLERCGVKTYKVNKFRTFFYYGTEEEGEKKYEKYMAK